MWFTYIPQLLLLPILCTGVVLLIIGLRGRLIAQPPHCRNCNYNLTGLTSPRCPECGCIIAQTGITTHRRQRRLRPIIAGLLILAPMLTLLIGFGNRFQPYLDGYRYKPNAWVLDDTQSTNLRLADFAYRRLERRLNQGKLTPKQIRTLADYALTDFLQEPPRHLAIQFQSAETIGWLLKGGHLANAQQFEFFENLAEVTMQTRATSLRSAGIPVALTVKYRYFPQWIFADYALVQITKQNATTSSAPPKPNVKSPTLNDMIPFSRKTLTAQPHRTFIDGGGRGHHQQTETWFIKADRTGPHEFPFTITIDILDQSPPGRTRRLYRITRSFTLDTNVVDAPRADDIKLVTDPSLESRMKSAVSIRVSRAPKGSHTGPNEDWIYTQLDVSDPPAALSFDIVVEAEGKTFRKRGTCFPGNSGMGRDGPFQTRGLRPDRVNVILVPNPTHAYRLVGTSEIWGRPLRFDNLLVHDTPQKPR